MGFPKRRLTASAGRASTVGIEFAAAVVGCLLLGYWADGKWGTTPWLTMGGLVLGTLSGFSALYKAAKQLERMQAKEREDGNGGDGQ